MCPRVGMDVAAERIKSPCRESNSGRPTRDLVTVLMINGRFRRGFPKVVARLAEDSPLSHFRWNACGYSCKVSVIFI